MIIIETIADIVFKLSALVAIVWIIHKQKGYGSRIRFMENNLKAVNLKIVRDEEKIK